MIFIHQVWFVRILSLIYQVWCICDNIWPFQDFFFSNFYVVTFSDLAKVKQGHSHMGSISSLYHSSMTNNPWKFHASTFICTITALIRPTNELWWPPKVKKGHDQTGSISALNHHGLTKILLKFHVFTSICTIVIPVPAPIQISGVIWPLMTSWRSKGAILLIFKHKVWFVPILSSIYQILIHLWRNTTISYFFSLFFMVWPLMTSPRSNKVTARWVLYQVWFIIVWLRFPESFMLFPKYAQ